MADFTAIRTSIAEQVASNCVPALTATSYAPDAVNVPCVIVMPGRPQSKFGITLGGGSLAADGLPMSPTEFRVDVILLVAKAATADIWQPQIDQWTGYQNDGNAVSLAMAIDLDPTLGGTVEFCEPLTIDPPGPIEWGGISYFGARGHLWVSAR